MDYAKMFRLDGKAAIVTGSASPQGIGAAVAEALAAQGAKVIITDLNDAEELAEQISERTGSTVKWLYSDVTNEDSVKEMVAKSIEEFKNIHIMVNNAGISLLNGTMKSPLGAPGSWEKMMNVNVYGVQRCVRSIVPHMQENGIKGSIINTGSTRGIRPSGPETGHAYSATKAAMMTLTRAWALEFAPYGIRVNAVCPGFVHTDISKMWYKDPETLKSVEGRIPLGKIADASEIAGMYAYLASDAASFVTGAMLMVDGGQSAYMHWEPPIE